MSALFSPNAFFTSWINPSPGASDGRSHFLFLISCSTAGWFVPMSTRIGSLSGAAIAAADFAIGSDDTCGFEAKARGEIDDAGRPVAVGAQQDVNPIRNQVVV